MFKIFLQDVFLNPIPYGIVTTTNRMEGGDKTSITLTNCTLETQDWSVNFTLVITYDLCFAKKMRKF